MSLLASLVLTGDTTIERRLSGATRASVDVRSGIFPALVIQADDPDDLDRLAAEIASAAESLRLARIASAGHAA